ncbi:small multidrug resistance protein [Gloeocapsa sp. BRSZ]
MSQSSTVRAKPRAYLKLSLSILFGITGQLLMKHTMSIAATELFTLSFVVQLTLALATYTIGVANWVLALRVVKLSVAYPLSSLNYVGILFGSYYFFNETITFTRILGVLLIFTGVLFVALSQSDRQLISK